MRTLILYESKFGNTAQIARAIADDLSDLGHVAVASIDEGMPDFDGVGLLVVCGPTQGHGVSAGLRALLDRVPAGTLNGIAAAAFDTRMRGPRWLTGSASKGIAHRLQEKGARLIVPAESFVVAGSEGPVVEADMTRAHAWASSLAAAFAPVS